MFPWKKTRQKLAFCKKSTHCWLELAKNSKKCSHKPNIPLSISELTTSHNIFVTVWPPGGAFITFAENWNFGLNFFWWILLGRQSTLGYFQSMFCPRMSLKCPKTRLFLAIKLVNVFGHFRPIFWQKMDPKYPGDNFLPKRIHQKKFRSKFQFSAKVMKAPPGGQTVTKNFWLVVNSEILKGIKNMFVLCLHFF